jgi:hypothetical protein
MHNILPTFLITLLNKCFLLGCFSKLWKGARAIAILKMDKSKLHTVQGRSISLLSVAGKCLGKLVVRRLNYFLESTRQIPPQQYGFTAGRSTVDTIKMVIEMVHRTKKQGTKCCLLALDIAGALDNAWHPAILARLWELKCLLNIYTIVKDFLQDRNVSVRVGDATSSKRITRGCLQGSVSGPTLWNIIISDLIVQLSKVPNLEMVTFANNILLMIWGPSHSAVLTTVVNTFRTIEVWCTKHRLEISKVKSALMPMYLRDRDKYRSHPEIAAWGLKVVSKMKYL